MKPDEKVYCGKCKWYKFHYSQWLNKHCICEAYDECKHLDNIKTGTKTTYAGKRKWKTWKLPPISKNKNNNCPDYEETLWKRLLKSLKNIIS